MSPHPSEHNLERFRRGELSARELAAVALPLIFAGVLFVALRQSETGPREVANQNSPAPATTPEVARVIDPTPSPTPRAAETPTPEANKLLPVLALVDGTGNVGLDGQGELIGLEALTPDEQRHMKEALAS